MSFSAIMCSPTATRPAGRRPRQFFRWGLAAATAASRQSGGSDAACADPARFIVERSPGYRDLGARRQYAIHLMAGANRTSSASSAAKPTTRTATSVGRAFRQRRAGSTRHKGPPPEHLRWHPRRMTLPEPSLRVAGPGLVRADSEPGAQTLVEPVPEIRMRLERIDSPQGLVPG